MTLYIIGNGFDLAHNLETGYCNYRKYIKENLKRNYKWEIILDYYPEEYEFWSDIEYNVCVINKEHYLLSKKLYRFGFLDDLFRQIHNSFERFILNRQLRISSLTPLFEFDNNSYFISFNYTSVLEDVYKIDSERIIYVHNDISGPALDILYNIQNHEPCIIGHSPFENEFALHNELLKDKEYKEYVKYTEKDCQTILKQKGIVKFLEDNKESINKVVFYGFSFSLTDKVYSKTLFDFLDNGKTTINVFYKVPDGLTRNDYIPLFKQRIKNCSINVENIKFLDCKNVNKI